MEVLDLKAMAEQAVALHRQGDLARAEALYVQILNAEPGLFGPHYYMGLIRLQQGRPDEACAFLAQAVGISPNETGALMNYGYGAARGRASRMRHSLHSSVCWRCTPMWRKRSTIVA